MCTRGKGVDVSKEIEIVVEDLQSICGTICSRIQSEDFIQSLEHYFAFAHTVHGVSLDQVPSQLPENSRI